MAAAGRAAAVLAGLDAEQAQAVTAPVGPVCIHAGAGTGKTRAVTHRIAHQVHTGVADPKTILAVTHSTHAAGEMRERLTRLGVPGVQVRTFHAAALRQLSYFWRHTSLPGDGVELVSSVRGGRYGMIRTAIAATLNVRPGDVESTDVLDVDGEITWAKAQRLTAKRYPAAALRAGRTRTLDLAKIATAYTHYEKMKTERALRDFDDLLADTAHLLETNTSVADRVRSQYQHFVVDEYQDTDPAQQRLLLAWLGGRDTVTVVGDPNQAIYAFKGADASLLTTFGRTFPHAVTVSLVRDYRSTPQIVTAANRLMTGTPGGSGTLIGQRPDGPDPVLRPYGTEVEEETGIANQVAALIAAGTNPAEIAVLHRFNAQAVRLEAALRDAGVPITVSGDEAFFRRPEIRRVLDTLSRAHPAADGLYAVEEALAREGFDPNTPPDGEGAARARWDAWSAFADLVGGWPEEVTARVDTLLAELASRARDEQAPSVGGAVTVATMHKAKGLEWDVVFLPRLAEGSMPSVFAKTPAEQDEERRLLYVAITRARQRLVLSYARQRGDGGRRQDPSRFLDVVIPSQTGSHRRPSRYASHGGAGKGGKAAASSAAPAAVIPGRVFVPGQRVTHDSYGMGKVVAIDRQGGVSVDFGGSAGVKTVKGNSPKLVKL